MLARLRPHRSPTALVLSLAAFAALATAATSEPAAAGSLNLQSVAYTTVGIVLLNGCGSTAPRLLRIS